MKRISHIVLSVLLFLSSHIGAHSEQLDSTVRLALDRKLAEYFAAIEKAGPQVQKEECDFMIATCTDSLMRQYVALAAYEHYRDSRVMGAEAVAVYLYDNWFGNGRIRMRNDAELIGAKVFADFNRQSLIGIKAPELKLSGPDGMMSVVFGPGDSSQRFRILYFYDTDCAACKVQTGLLGQFLESNDYPVDLLAVYVDDSEEEWRDYIKERFSMDFPQTKVMHLWDPEMESDFQLKYGVLQTPCMFLISPDGTIIGRRLDVAALSQLLESIFREVGLEYGSSASAEMFDGLLSAGPQRGGLRLDDITSLTDGFVRASLEKGDTVMCRQFLGDLLYYLAPRTDEGSREGLDYLIDRYIMARSDIWKSSDDSVKVVGYADMMNDLLSRSTPGKRIADIKIEGTLLKRSSERTLERSLRRIGGKRNIILFHTRGCNVCAAEKEAAAALVREDKDVNVFMVDVDGILSDSYSVASRLFDMFDLSTLPFIIETDKKGYIRRRYISLVK